jgi:1-deoxyxylulose-5-phosphate synthase
VAKVAAARGCCQAQVALAWLLQAPGVTAPIIGATKLGHIDDAVKSLDVHLTPAEIAELGAPDQPHPYMSTGG